MWVNITVTHEDYTELWSDLHTLYCENSGVEGSRGRHGHQTRQTAGEGWGPGGANDRRLPVSRGPLRWSRVTYEIGYAPIKIRTRISLWFSSLFFWAIFPVMLSTWRFIEREIWRITRFTNASLSCSQSWKFATCVHGSPLIGKIFYLATIIYLAAIARWVSGSRHLIYPVKFWPFFSLRMRLM